MKKSFIACITVAVSLIMSGCASNGMGVNTLSGNRVERTFIEGSIIKQQKVVIDNRELAILTGAGIGAVGGAVAKGGKGALIGGVIGGVAGAVVGNEVEAFQTSIKGDDEIIYQGYLEHRLNEGTRVEFTVVDGKLKNVGVINNQNTQVKKYH